MDCRLKSRALGRGSVARSGTAAVAGGDCAGNADYGCCYIGCWWRCYSENRCMKRMSCCRRCRLTKYLFYDKKPLITPRVQMFN